MELLNVVRKSLSSSSNSLELEKKSFRKASKVLFSALLCWVWESERRRTEQKESNYGKFMVWSKHIFSLFKWIRISYRRIHFFITHELELPLFYYLPPEKKSWKMWIMQHWIVLPFILLSCIWHSKNFLSASYSSSRFYIFVFSCCCSSFFSNLRYFTLFSNFQVP